MAKVLDWYDSMADMTFALARTTQAAAVEGIDRLTHLGPRARRRQRHNAPVAALMTLTRRLVGEPDDLIDRGYLLTARLVELHREFAQRVLEILDAEAAGALDDGSSQSRGRSTDRGPL